MIRNRLFHLSFHETINHLTELKKQNQELKSKIKDLLDKLESIQQQFSEAKQNYTIKK